MNFKKGDRVELKKSARRIFSGTPTGVVISNPKRPGRIQVLQDGHKSHYTWATSFWRKAAGK